MENVVNSIIDQKLDFWKKELLEKSASSPLVNLRETLQTLRITFPENSTLLYNQLVEDEIVFEFPVEQTKRTDQEEDDIPDFDINSYKSTNSNRDILFGENKKWKTTNKLRELKKTLRTIRLRTLSNEEETGLHNLFLTFGCLEWYESDNSDIKRRSPVIIVPVNLNKYSINDPFILSKHEDEVFVNPILENLLIQDFGINLPTFDDENTDVDSYLHALEASVSLNSTWTVTDECFLAPLSFRKIEIYKDIESNLDFYKEHPIINQLANVKREIDYSPEFSFDPIDIDQISSKEIFQVLDADSSQQEAIEFAKQGKSFVLQGPPGTGKSQTITNIIVEMLGNGKKVLFVSEKMAALDVVASRIEKVGLKDYTLTLQSRRDKAGRKKLVDDLMNCFSTDVETEDSYAIGQYYREFEIRKQTLNTYAKQVHEIINPLGLTMYQVQGSLVKLGDLHQLAALDPLLVRKVTREELKSLEDELHEIANLKMKLAENNSSKYWDGHEKISLTLQLRQEIPMHGEILLRLFQSIQELIDEIERSFGMSGIHTIEDLMPFRQIFDDLRFAKPIQKEWLSLTNFQALEESLQDIANLKDRIKGTVQNISDYFGVKFIRSDLHSILVSAEKCRTDVLEIFSVSSINSLPNLKELTGWIKDVDACYFQLSNHMARLAEIYPNLLSADIGKLIKTAPQFIIWPKLIGIPAQWLESVAYFRDVRSTFDEAKASYLSLAELEQKIKASCCSGPYGFRDIDWSVQASWLRTHDSMASVLWPTYRRIKSLVKSFVGNSIHRQEVVEIVQLLSKFQETEKFITENLPKYQGIFGNQLFDGKRTAWDNLGALIDATETMFTYNKHGYPVSMASHIFEKLKQKEETCSELTQALLTSIEELQLCLEKCPAGLDAFKLKLFSSNINYGKELLQSAQGFTKYASQFTNSMNLPLEVFNLTLFENLNNVKVFLDQKNAYDVQRVQLIAALNLKRDAKPDWLELLNNLVWAEELSKKPYREMVVSELGEQLFSADEKFTTDCARVYEVLNEVVHNLEGKSFGFFTHLFQDKTKWRTIGLAEAISQIDGCIKNISVLEDAIKLEDLTSEEKLSPILGGLIPQLGKMDVTPDRWVDVFRKSFFIQWYDTQINSFEALKYFNIEKHSQIIEEFKKKDVEQLDIAVRRVKNRLDSLRPTVSNAFGGEALVIKKEAMKKRKFMSIRRLMNEIPTLILDMKPCFLMSPLAVSQYLKPDLYKFDVILFDEASQIKTHDAITSIVRGKQVIIVGDTKQLPPTSFFETSSSGDEYDTLEDEEEEKEDAFESVLEEASMLMPSLTLRWHYRSKFEQLILFSNSEFYQNKLITFPSQSYLNAHGGVEHVFVPDGVYDRGKSRRNIVEAQKVVDLVFEHLAQFPKRSLGIVACSQAQQYCIEDELEKRREAYPEFEPFFLESVDEPIFIKNIETVQGDERDTIFFSIGYGPLIPGGPVPLSFGPINRAGGEKRLNVAITRARENLRVISSFHANRVNVSNSNSIGAKMLLSYLQYAEQGVEALPKSVSHGDSWGETESLFEESVKEFLNSEGYDVNTQVGCSQYRIDLGLIDPRAPGRYLLGIECDGAQYHSSRTARERDRLRQQVLERMGWKIIRVWSTDWLKNPYESKIRLKHIISQALEDSDPASDMSPKVSVDTELDASSMFGSKGSGNSETNEQVSVSSMTLDQLPEFVDFIPDSSATSVDEVLEDFKMYLKTNQPVTLNYLVRALKDTNIDSDELRSFRRNPDSVTEKALDFYIDSWECIWPSSADIKLITIPRRNTELNKRDTTSTISMSEVMGLVYICVHCIYGPTLDEIIEQYKAAFNFKRAGAGIKDTIERVILTLIQREYIVERDGKYLPGRKQFN